MISDFYAALKARMPEGFPMFFGSKHLFDNARPPRIVVVPTTERFGPPISGRDEQRRPVKSILTRSPNLDVYFWGKNATQTEQMMESWIQATHREAATSYKVGIGEWLDNRQLAGVLTNGDLYRLPITFDKPIAPAETWVTLESIAMEFSIGLPLPE